MYKKSILPLSIIMLLTILAMMIVLVSCSSDPPPSPPGGTTQPSNPALAVNPMSLTFTSDGGTAELEISASDSWTISVSESGNSPQWVSLSATSGAAGSQTVSVTVDKNSGYDERNVTLKVATEDGRTANVVVVQKQLDAILASSDKIEIEAEGGSFDIEVASNVDYECEIAPQSQSWLRQIEPTRGLTTRTLSFEVDPNEFVERREGVIIFKSGDIREEVTIYQAQSEIFVLSVTQQFLPSTEGRFSIELRSNMEFEWRIAEGESWLHADQTRAISSHTLYFSYDANPQGDDQRFGRIDFTAANGATASVDVVQRAPGRIILNDDIVRIPASGGEFLISYDAQTAMAVEYPQWCEMVSNKVATRGIQAYNLWLRAASNYSSEERQASVRVYDMIQPHVSQTVTVIQEGCSAGFTLSCPEGSFPDAKTHTFSIAVQSNVPYELQMPDEIISLGNGQYKVEGLKTASSKAYWINLLVAGHPVQTAKIEQSMPVTPRLDATSAEVSPDGGEFTIPVYCNTDMRLVIPAEATSWISFKNADVKTGHRVDSWTFTASANTGAATRSADISVENNLGFKQTFTVTQSVTAPEVTADGTVTLPRAGELSTALTAEQKNSLSAIAIVGGINSADVATLREMLTGGSLRTVDLSRTELKKDPSTIYFTDHIYAHLYKGALLEDNQIGNYMFYDTRVQKVTFPANLKEIGHYAFVKSDIVSVEIPEGVESIGRECFNGCESLQTASLPSTLAEVPAYSFFACTALKKVVLKPGLKKIGKAAFTPIDATSRKGSLVDVVLPDGLEEIEDFAFNCQLIKEVEIPSSVRRMGWNTFKENRMLTSATFRNEMDTLPRGTFEMCASLTSVVLPKGLKVIGKSALAHTAIKSFSVPEGVVVLDENAIEGMAVQTLTLPSTLERISDWSLGQLTELESLTIPARVNYIGRYAFSAYQSVLKEIHMKPTAVPDGDGEYFNVLFDYNSCVLYVPRGSRDAYAAHKVWGRFKDIREE